MLPRTQKGRGINYLLCTHPPLGIKNHPEAYVYRGGDRIGILGSFRRLIPRSYLRFPYFARPCPVKPRHGFVESRTVNNVQELDALLQEAQNADPRAEIILTSKINANYSAVVTENSVTLGLGTDGATSGKPGLTLSCNGTFDSLFYERVIKGQTINPQKYISFNPIKHDLYIETVDKHIVQLRTGPRIKNRSTLIVLPERYGNKFHYTQTLTASESTSFSDFETLLDGALTCETVVHLPNSSLSSHFAVQALARGFAVSVEPILSLSPLMNNNSIFYGAASQIHAVTKGLNLGTSINFSNHADLIRSSCAIIQSCAVDMKSPPNMYALTAASVIIARFAASACLGEYRHFAINGPWSLNRQLPLGPSHFSVKGHEHANKSLITAGKKSRSVTSRKWFNASRPVLKHGRLSKKLFHAVLPELVRIKHDFLTKRWSSGFGGDKWGEIVNETITLCLEIENLCFSHQSWYKFPYSLVPNLGPLVAAANRLINTSHNNGKCLNKFVGGDSTVFNHISSGLGNLYIATNSEYLLKGWLEHDYTN